MTGGSRLDLMKHHVLVIDPDHEAGEAAVAVLQRNGFLTSHVVGLDAPLTGTEKPDLILASVRGSDMARLVTLTAALATVPVIVRGVGSSPEERVAVLRAGADDVVADDIDDRELVARCRSLLRRAMRLSNTSPLTGLPGNQDIARELRRRIADADLFAVAHVDIGDFKTINDAYGFLRGDAVITFCADCLRSAVAVTSGPTFLGHIGGDDFVAILDPADIESFCTTLIGLWDASIGSHYDRDHAAAGGITVVDRLANPRHFPIASLSIGVATNERRSFTSEWEASAIASEMKAYAKRQPGSNFRVDRRVR